MNRTFAAATALILVGTGMAFASPASAAGSSFTGTITSPARGDKVVTIRGDLTIDPADCPATVGDLEHYSWKPVYVGLFKSDGTFMGWLYYTDKAETRYMDERGALDPGTYQLKLGALYERGTVSKVLPCVDLSPTIITVVSETATSRETVASVRFLYAGETFTLSLDYVITWSDGVTTRKPAPNVEYGYELQSRLLGTADWESQDIDGPSVTVLADEPREYRILYQSALSKPITVDVIRATSAREIVDVTVTPATAIVGATLTLAGTIRSQFTDGTWRPSPAGTPYEVQFLPSGGAEWIRLYESTVTDVGAVSAKFPVSGSGRYRVASNDALSASIEVTAVVPTSVVAVEPLALPTAIAAGTPINISSTAQVEYSDGVYRPVAPGTSYTVEFRTATSPRTGERAKPRWQAVRTVAVTQPGVLTTRVKAKASGFWRLRLGSTVTPAVFVRVRGR
jgi:hypothetical protein